MRIHALAASAALMMVTTVLAVPEMGDGKKAAKKNCISVSGVEKDSRVTLEYQDKRGGWHNVVSKVIGKDDPIPWEYCGLKPGTKYRVIARMEGDANADNWKEFVFQPDAKTGVMQIRIEIKMPPPQR